MSALQLLTAWAGLIHSKIDDLVPVSLLGTVFFLEHANHSPVRVEELRTQDLVDGPSLFGAP